MKQKLMIGLLAFLGFAIPLGVRAEVTSQLMENYSAKNLKEAFYFQFQVKEELDILRGSDVFFEADVCEEETNCKREKIETIYLADSYEEIMDHMKMDSCTDIAKGENLIFVGNYVPGTVKNVTFTLIRSNGEGEKVYLNDDLSIQKLENVSANDERKGKYKDYFVFSVLGYNTKDHVLSMTLEMENNIKLTKDSFTLEYKVKEEDGTIRKVTSSDFVYMGGSPIDQTTTPATGFIDVVSSMKVENSVDNIVTLHVNLEGYENDIELSLNDIPFSNDRPLSYPSVGIKEIIKSVSESNTTAEMVKEQVLKTYNGEFKGELLDSQKAMELCYYEANSALASQYDVCQKIRVYDYHEKNIETIKKEIDESLKNKDFSVVLKDNRKITKEVLKEIKEKKYVVTFIIDGPLPVSNAWTFDGEKLDDIDSDIDPTIRFGEGENVTEINYIIKELNQPLILHFDYHGKLPNGIQLSIYVSGEYEDGTVLDLYYYNPETKKFEDPIKDLVVDLGYVNFTINHCSDYVFHVVEPSKNPVIDENKKDEMTQVSNPSKNTNNPQTSSLNIGLYLAICVASLIGMFFLKKMEEVKK